MEVLSTPDEARQLTLSLRNPGRSGAGRSVGLVPTMGALHAGHLSLVQRSTEVCDATIATIFVNPTQFAPSEDLDRYPRTLDQDLELLRQAGVEAVFIPTSQTMYPEGFSTYVQPPEVAKPLEGVCRPGHFRGVTTIVMKLFQIIPATHAFFGKKDYQQWKVIETMVRDLDVGIEIVAGEIVREPDGLALSSRNRYLSSADRRRALLLSAALRGVADSVRRGERDAEQLQAQIRQTLLANSADQLPSSEGVDQIDYAAVVDAETLIPLTQLDRPAVALIAATVSDTRLIDNCELEPA